MPQTLTLDFVSDIACPWCAVGLGALQQALRNCADAVPVRLQFQPFELNPDMGPEGEDMAEHLGRKYGSSPEQQAQIRAAIAERGAAVGFAFHPDGRGRIVNTFKAHRLLHWAGLQGTQTQLDLKWALLRAYHGRADRVDHDDVLLAAVHEAGLDRVQAQQVLDDGSFADEVRQAERFWQEAGIRSVPALVINRQHLISGGQPPEVFEAALRELSGTGSAA